MPLLWHPVCKTNLINTTVFAGILTFVYEIEVNPVKLNKAISATGEVLTFRLSGRRLLANYVSARTGVCFNCIGPTMPKSTDDDQHCAAVMMWIEQKQPVPHLSIDRLHLPYEGSRPDNERDTGQLSRMTVAGHNEEPFLAKSFCRTYCLKLCRLHGLVHI